MKVAVVGAGIAGLSAARSLAERGHTVTVYEQFDLFHTRGSSHGNSRIVRKAYPDAFYTDIMLQAYPMWADLQERSTLPILHEPGLIYFGMADSPKVISVIEALADLGVEHVVEHGSPLRDSHLKLVLGEVGVFTPEAGWVHAANALRATWELASAAGAQLKRERAHELSVLERQYDKVVVCAGGWITKFVDLPVTVTLQTYAYVEAVQDGPVWIEASDLGIYGFPTEPGGSGVKIGVHRLGRDIDADSPDRSFSGADLEIIREFAERRFGLADPQLRNPMGCIYTTTIDEDFRVGALSSKSFFVSACSGHGFKFGPWLGEFAADIAEEKKGIGHYPRFAA